MKRTYAVTVNRAALRRLIVAGQLLRNYAANKLLDHVFISAWDTAIADTIGSEVKPKKRGRKKG